eukprot:2814536-Pyramimonas_sp.AAC.1
MFLSAGWAILSYRCAVVVTLEAYWDHFGDHVDLSWPSWRRLGGHVGPYWPSFWTALSSSWADLGPSSGVMKLS